MANLLDKFESLVLNYSRRIISLLILLSLIVAGGSFLYGMSNMADSADVEITDSFTIPSFEKPKELQQAAPAETPKQENNEPSQKQDDWAHPMPNYRGEIADIVDDIFPLYQAFFGWEDTLDQKRKLTAVVAANLDPYQDALAPGQMDDVVDGLVDYIDDFSDFYVDRHNIDTSNIEVKSDSKMNELLKNPFGGYLDEVTKNFSKLAKEAKIAEAEATANNISAVQQLIVAAITFGIIVLLVLILLIFKSENSLRRQADALEKSS